MGKIKQIINETTYIKHTGNYPIFEYKVKQGTNINKLHTVEQIKRINNRKEDINNYIGVIDDK